MAKNSAKTPALGRHLIALPDKRELQDAAATAKEKSLDQLQEDIQRFHQAATASATNALFEAIRAGVELLEVKRRLAHGFWTDWLANNFSPETGLSTRTAQRYMSAAKKWLVSDTTLDPNASQPSLETLSLTRLLQSPAPSTASSTESSRRSPKFRGNDWLTPTPIIDAAVSLLGAIDLDPAAETAASNVPAKTHITVSDNALRPDAVWQGRVFLNAGCEGNLVPWVTKAVAAFNGGQISQAVLLLPAGGHHNWSPLIRTFPRAYCRELLQVVAAEGGQTATLNRPLMIVYLTTKPDIDLFAKCFSRVCDVFVPFCPKESKR